jgi:hypothetical protein
MTQTLTTGAMIPTTHPGPVDALEIHRTHLVEVIDGAPCWMHEDDLDPGQPTLLDATSVFLHIPDHGLECVADCATDREAQLIAEILAASPRVHELVPEGHPALTGGAA